MSKHQLTQLLNKGQKKYTKLQQTWLQRYNDVIQAYNVSADKQAKLDKLFCTSKAYLFICKLLNNYLFNIVIVLTLIFLPLVNLLLQIYLISYTFYLKKQTNKHLLNLQKVKDPFQKFYYYPQMCQQLQKHFTTLNLTIQQIQNFKFNQSHNKFRQSLLLKNKNDNDQNTTQQINKKRSFVKVPIYDQYFYDSFFLVRKQYFKSLGWSILGIALIPLCVLFYAAVYQDFIE